MQGAGGTNYEGHLKSSWTRLIIPQNFVEDSDSLFFKAPPLASDALLTMLHPLLKNVLQTDDHFLPQSSLFMDRSMFLISGWSAVRSASLTKEGTSKKRPSLHLHKVPTWSNKVSLRTFQTALIRSLDHRAVSQ
jgi:hypothetical protein